MNVKCNYCLRVHPMGYICEKKKQAIENRNKYRVYKHKAEYKGLTDSSIWKKTREYIKDRDNYCCLVCKAQGQIVEAREVHHIVKVIDDRTKQYDETNLISLCIEHHKESECGHIESKYLNELVNQSIKEYKDRMM